MTTGNIIFLIVNLVFLGLNIFVFLKLKKAGDQVMKMAFPNAKNMNEAMGQMQSMLGGMNRGGGRGGNPFAGMNNKDMQSQMKMAMDMLNQMQKKR